MSRASKAGRRLRESWNRDGIKGVAADLLSYLAWKSSGSPSDTGQEDDSRARLEALEAAIGVLLARERYAEISPRTSPLISVILPTRGRPELLCRAVASVVDQTYQNWQLLIVDDSSASPEPRPIGTDDERIQRLETGGVGVGAARNAGLDKAEGEFITFLDDDNTMNSQWLTAVVSELETNPDRSSLVGAQLVFPERGSSEVPRVRFPTTFDWATLTEYNYIDLGMLAHRPMPDLRFDESLPAFLDWDYVVRLTKDHPPLLVPAISGSYFTDAPGRISYGQRRELQHTLQARFKDLKDAESPSQGGAATGLSDEDVVALQTLIHRLVGNRGPIEILDIGAPSSLPTHITTLADPSVRWSHANEVEGAEVYDLVLVGDPAAFDIVGRLAATGLVIGLHGHRVDYTRHFPSLMHHRRVGDTLWVGSAAEFEPEALFPGAALIKLGHDRPQDVDSE